MSADITALLHEARKSLHCLVYEVPDKVYVDVCTKIGGALDALEDSEMGRKAALEENTKLDKAWMESERNKRLVDACAEVNDMAAEWMRTLVTEPMKQLSRAEELLKRFYSCGGDAAIRPDTRDYFRKRGGCDCPAGFPYGEHAPGCPAGGGR